MLSRSYQNGPALIGAIFGTGTNGAYIDKSRTISKLGEEKISAAEKGGDHAGKFMVVNTEWGAFDNGVRAAYNQANIFLEQHWLTRSRDIVCLSRYSIISLIENLSIRMSFLLIHADGTYSRKQAFEKMVSGMCKF